MVDPTLETRTPTTVEEDTQRDQLDRRATGRPGVELDDASQREAAVRHNAGRNPFDIFITDPVADNPITADTSRVDTTRARELATQIGAQTWPLTGGGVRINESGQVRVLHNYLEGAHTPEQQVERLLVIAAIPAQGVANANLQQPRIANLIEQFRFSDSPEVRQAAHLAMAAIGDARLLERQMRDGNEPTQGQLQQFADIQGVGMDFDHSQAGVQSIADFTVRVVRTTEIPDPDLAETDPTTYQRRLDQLENQSEYLTGLMNVTVTTETGGVTTTTHPYRTTVLNQVLAATSDTNLSAQQRERMARFLVDPAREAVVNPDVPEATRNNLRTFIFSRIQGPPPNPELGESIATDLQSAIDNGELNDQWRDFIIASLDNEGVRAQMLGHPDTVATLHNIAIQPTPEGLAGDDLARYEATRNAIQSRLAEFATSEDTATSPYHSAVARRMFEQYTIAMREGTLDPNQALLMDRVIDNPNFVAHLTNSSTMMDRALTAVEAEVPEGLEGPDRDAFVNRQARLRAILVEGLRTEHGSETAGHIVDRVHQSLESGNPSATVGQLFDEMLQDDAVMARLRANPEAIADLTDILYMEAPEGLEGADLTTWQTRQTQVTERLTALMATPEGAPFAQAAYNQYIERLAEGEPLPENYVERMNAMLGNDAIRAHIVSHSLDVASQTITDDNRDMVETTREFVLGQALGDNATQFTEALVDRYYSASTPGPVPQGLQDTMTMMTSVPLLNPFVRANIAAYADRLEAAGETDKATAVRGLATS